MSSLLDELVARGDLYAVAATWARAEQRTTHESPDSVLLRLELVDEEGLLRGLESHFGVPAATPADLAAVDTTLAPRLPRYFRRLKGVAPVGFAGGELVTMADRPLSEKLLQEMHGQGVRVRQLVAPSCYIEMARHKVFGIAASDQAERLTARLAQLRQPEIRSALARLAASPTLGHATTVVVDFVGALLEFACLLTPEEGALRVGDARGGVDLPGEIAVASRGCSLTAALGGGPSFVGPVADADEERALFRALGRPLPRWALVVPVRAADGIRAVLCADNGVSGMAPRRVAEVALLLARLGDRADERLVPATVTGAAGETMASAPAEPVTEAAARSAEHGAEQPPGEADRPVPLAGLDPGVLDRLVRASVEAGIPLEMFVESLLHPEATMQQSEPQPAAVLDMQQALQQMATDLPQQLERSLRVALRELAPRTAALRAGASYGGLPATSADGIQLVSKDPTEREVGDYRSKRKRLRLIEM